MVPNFVFLITNIVWPTKMGFVGYWSWSTESIFPLFSGTISNFYNKGHSGRVRAKSSYTKAEVKRSWRRARKTQKRKAKDLIIIAKNTSAKKDTSDYATTFLVFFFFLFSFFYLFLSSIKLHCIQRVNWGIKGVKILYFTSNLCFSSF